MDLPLFHGTFHDRYMIIFEQLPHSCKNKKKLNFVRQEWQVFVLKRRPTKSSSYILKELSRVFWSWAFPTDIWTLCELSSEARSVRIAHFRPQFIGSKLTVFCFLILHTFTSLVKGGALLFIKLMHNTKIVFTIYVI